MTKYFKLFLIFVTLIVIFIFVFLGKGPSLETTEDLLVDSDLEVCYQTYDQNNISFNYPCDWKISTENRYEVNIFPADHTSNVSGIYVSFPAESPAEFMETFEEYIQEGKISIHESSFSHDDIEYVAMEFRQHGAVHNFIEVDEIFVRVASEFYLSDEDLEDLYSILDSLEAGTQ